MRINIKIFSFIVLVALLSFSCLSACSNHEEKEPEDETASGSISTDRPAEDFVDVDRTSVPRTKSEPELQTSTAPVISIPQKLTQHLWGGNAPLPEAYCPTITFYEDMHCEMSLNMLEWIQDAAGTYEAFLYSDGSEVIKCKLNNPDLGDGMDRALQEFILVKTAGNEWTFYGQLMGATSTGDVLNAANNASIDISTEIIATYLPEVGEYLDDGSSEVHIGEFEDDRTVRVSIDWYRLTGVEDIPVTLYGNYAVFNYFDEGIRREIRGYIELLSDQKISLVIAEDIGYVKTGMATYEFVSEEDLKVMWTEWLESILLFNDDICGWSKKGRSAYDSTYFDAIFMHFYENGSFKYWIGTDQNVDVTYTGYNGTYKLEEDILYIDGYAYDIYAEQTGVVHFTINAINEDPLNLSGEYICEENEMYQFLLQN